MKRQRKRLWIGFEAWCHVAAYSCVREVHRIRLLCTELCKVRAAWPRPPPQAAARSSLAKLGKVQHWHLDSDELPSADLPALVSLTLWHPFPSISRYPSLRELHLHGDLTPGLLEPVPLEELLVKTKTGRQDLLIPWVATLKPTLRRLDFFPDTRDDPSQELLDLLSSSSVLEHLGFHVGNKNYRVLLDCVSLSSLSVVSYRFRCSAYSSLMNLLSAARLETVEVHGYFQMYVPVSKTVTSLVLTATDCGLDIEETLLLTDACIYSPSALILWQLSLLPGLQTLRLENIDKDREMLILNQTFPRLTSLELVGRIVLPSVDQFRVLFPELRELVLHDGLVYPAEFDLADLRYLPTLKRGSHGDWTIWASGKRQSVRRHCDFCKCLIKR